MSDNQSRRRTPVLGVAVALLFLVVPVAGVAWWLNRPKSETPSPTLSLAELDVLCIGRVDGAKPVIHLEPAMPGKIVKLHANLEGKHVAAGEPLLELDDKSLALRVKEADAAIKVAEIEVEAAKQEAKLYPIRKATQEAAVVAAADRVVTARRVLDEKKLARSFGTATPGEVAVAESEVKQYEQLEGVEKSRLEELKLADPNLKVRAAEAKHVIATIAREQAQKTLEDCVLRAPVAGTVLRVQASVGQSLAPGSPLPPIVFRPEGSLVVRAEIQQEFLGRVKAGMKATLRDDVRADSPIWTGRVESIGQLVAPRKTILLEPGEFNDVRTIECVIALDGKPEGLLVGQRMRVRIAKD